MRAASHPKPLTTRRTARASRSRSPSSTRDSWPMATSTSSRSICSRSARSAAAARPSTAVWPSDRPKRTASPDVISDISAGVSSPASCRATAATSCSSADPYSTRTARSVASVPTASNSPRVAPSRR